MNVPERPQSCLEEPLEREGVRHARDEQRQISGTSKVVTNRDTGALTPVEAVIEAPPLEKDPQARRGAFTRAGRHPW